MLGAADRLRQRGIDAVGVVLPVEFEAAGRRIVALVAEHAPELVIAFGLAEDRTAVTPERVAINVDDARLPDNAGYQPQEVPIDEAGPAASFSTLPITAIVAALRDAGLAAEVSNSAGTYVCNHVFYRLLQATAGTPTRAGFVHVPLSGEVAQRAVDVAVAACLN